MCFWDLQTGEDSTVCGGQICLPSSPRSASCGSQEAGPRGLGDSITQVALATGFRLGLGNEMWQPAIWLAGGVKNWGNLPPPHRPAGLQFGGGSVCSSVLLRAPPLLLLQPRAWEQLATVARPRALPDPLWFLQSAHTSVNSPFAKLFPINPLVERAIRSC